MLFRTVLAQADVEPISQVGNPEITSITSDSRRCSAGSCFVALNGSEVDGHNFIVKAIEAGASSVIAENSGFIPQDFPHAIVADSHKALGLCAQALNDKPADKMTCIGITGTNGKSTVAHLVHNILIKLGKKSGMIGTITYETQARSIPASMTTPPAENLAQMLAEMVKNDVSHLVMEVSSHALDQQRTAGINFKVAAFTNLSGDHLDYHKTMEDYLVAKTKLFSNLDKNSVAVLNCDDQVTDKIAQSTNAEILNYGLNPLADLRAKILKIDADGSDFEIINKGKQVSVHTPLIGRHNVLNCLAAAGICASLGISIDEIVKALREIKNVPGRLERVDSTSKTKVFVDYAHTDDALANVLGALRPITKGRVIVVFGCGGNRDKTKRPRMGAVAQQLSDYQIVTSDNPRNEEPVAIIEDICQGMTQKQTYCVEPDRRKAIAHAIEIATDDDVVLIAGKGHENYQLIKGVKTDFDDSKVAAKIIASLEERA